MLNRSVKKRSFQRRVAYVLSVKGLVTLVYVVLSLGCIVGFGYHSGQFIKTFFEYPVRSDYEVITEKDPRVPAITLCSEIGYNLTDGETFIARKNVSLRWCFKIWSNKFPNVRRRCLLSLANYSETMAMAWKYKTIVLSCSPRNNCSPPKNTHWIFNVEYGNCFTLNGNVTGKMLSRAFVVKDEKKAYDLKVANVNSSRFGNYYSINKSRILVTIHDRRHIPDITSEMNFLDYGALYHIYVKKVFRTYPGYPYLPKCKDYKSEWVKNKRSPYSQSMCMLRCYVKLSQRIMKCLWLAENSPTITEAYLKSKCNESVIAEFGDNKDDKAKNPAKNNDSPKKKISHWKDTCKKECPEDCQRFLYDFQESKDGKTGFSYTELKVHFATFEYTVSSFKPVYKSVEVFGYVGGYIGIWLGVSLLDLPAAILFLFGRCFAKRTEGKKERRVKSSKK